MGVKPASGTTLDQPETVEQGPVTEPSITELQNYITAETGLDPDTIADQAAEWQNKIPFLSAVAAHYLVCREHRLNPAKHFRTERDLSLEIANLQPDMNDVELQAKVADTFLHNPDEEDWRFLAVTLRDDTGSVELMLWNERIDKYKDVVTQGAQIRISNGYTETYEGDVQVRIGDSPTLEQVDD